MLSTSDLVQEIRKYETLTPLKDSLGDGFLYQNNPIFKNIRREATRIGVTFSNRRDLYHHQSCPNLAFNQILRYKKVPYLTNIKPLLRIQKVDPHLPLDKILLIKRNNILHESAHLVAHSLFQRQSTADHRYFVFTSLLGEAYACSCETVGQIYFSNEMHERIYQYNTNVYGCNTLDYSQLLKRVSDEFGLKVAFRLTMTSFLAWSFFCSPFEENEMRRVLSVCGYTGKLTHRNLKLLVEFCEFHFHINGFFRKEIAAFYFRSCGLNEPLAKLVGFNFLSYFESLDQKGGTIQKMTDILFRK